MSTITKRRNPGGSISYIAQVRIKGFKPVGKAFETKPEALSWADALERELRRQHERGGVRKDVTKLTVAQLAKEYLNDPEVKKKKYIGKLESLLEWWTTHVGTERVLEFNVLKIRDARNLISKGRSPATTNRYLAAMRSCWNWGRTSGLLPQDLNWPTRLMLTEARGRTRHLSDEELVRLLKAATDHSPLMRTAVLIAVGTGIRLSEMLGLKWSDVDLENSVISLQHTKNGESRSVHLPKSSADAIRSMKKKAVLSPHIFSDDEGQPLGIDRFEIRWNKVRAAAELVDFRWHDLRHSCASFLAAQGANLLEIGSVLGHKSPSVTQRYAHLVQGKPVTGHAALELKLAEAIK